MKRDSKSNSNNLQRCNTILFWNKCCICHKEFKKENGWKFDSNPKINGVLTRRYICKSCAPNREIAENIVEGRKHHSKPVSAFVSIKEHTIINNIG